MVQPLAEMSPAEVANGDECYYGEVPCIDFSTGEKGHDGKKVGPFRCSRCQGYMNVHTLFEANGSKAKCNLCGTITDVPAEHFGPINEYGQRLDSDQKPEYRYGTYEFLLPSDWIGTTPVLPTYVFCLDISSTAIMNGFFYQSVTTIKQCLDYFPNPEVAEMCVATFD